MPRIVVQELLVKLGTDITSFSRGLQKAQRSMAEVGAEMRQIGMGMTAAITLPIAGAAAAGIKFAGDFQQGMNKVRAVSGATGKAFDDMRQQALELGRTTAFSATQASNAMGFLAMAGFKAGQIMKAMPSTLQLASAATIDLGTAADITSNILTGYGMKVSQLGHANDVLVKAFTSANVDLRMLGQSFKYVGPIAKGAGLSFEETAAALAMFGNAGIQGSMAGTALRRALSKLLNTTPKVDKALRRLGVSVKDSQGRLLPLVQIVKQLEDAGASASDMLTIFGDRAGPAMKALVDQGSAALANLTAKLRESGGTAARIEKTQLAGFRGAIIKMKSALEGLAIAFGDTLLPVATGVANWATKMSGHLTKMAERFGKLSPTVKMFSMSLMGLAAAAGPVLMISGMLVGEIAKLKLLGPVLGSVGGAIKTFGVRVRTLGAGRAVLGALGSTLSTVVTPAAIAFIAVMSAKAIADAASGFYDLATAILGVGNKTQDASDKAVVLNDVLETTADKQRKLQIEMLAAKGTIDDYSISLAKIGKSLSWMGSLSGWWKKIFPPAALGDAFRGLAKAIDLLKGHIAGGNRMVTATLKKTLGAQHQLTVAWANQQMAAIAAQKAQSRAAALRIRQDKNIAHSSKAQAAATKEATNQARIQARALANINRLQNQIAAADERIASQKTHLTSLFVRAAASFEKTTAVAADSVSKQLTGFKMLPPAIKAALAATKNLNDAYTQLGVTSTSQLQKSADALAKSAAVVIAMYGKGRATMADMLQAQIKATGAQIKANLSAGKSADDLITKQQLLTAKLNGMGVAAQKTGKQTANVFISIGNEVNNAFGNVVSGLSDVILQGRSMGDVLNGVFSDLKRNVVDLSVNYLRKELMNSLQDVEGEIGGIGDLLNGLFGVGGKTSGNLLGGLKKSGGIGGLLTKAITGSFAQIASVITGAISSITDVLGYIQGRHTEKDTARMEVTSREIKNILLSILDDANKYWPGMDHLAVLDTIEKRAFGIYNILGEMAKSEGLAIKVAQDAISTVKATTAAAAKVVATAADNTTAAVTDTTAATSTVQSAVIGTSANIVSGLSDTTSAVTSGFSNVVSSVNTVAAEAKKTTIAIDSWAEVLKSIGYNTNRLDKGGMLPASVKSLDYLRWLPNLDIPLSNIADSIAAVFGKMNDWMGGDTKITKSNTKAHTTLTNTLIGEQNSVEGLIRTLSNTKLSIHDVRASLRDAFTSGSSALKTSVIGASQSIIDTTHNAVTYFTDAFRGFNKSMEDGAKSVQQTAKKLVPGIRIFPLQHAAVNVGGVGTTKHAVPGVSEWPWDYANYLSGGPKASTPTNTLNVYVQGANEREQVDRFISELRRRGVDI